MLDYFYINYVFSGIQLCWITFINYVVSVIQLCWITLGITFINKALYLNCSAVFTIDFS